MNPFLIEHQNEIRLMAFFGIFFIMAMAEVIKPYRKLTQNKLQRWKSNLTLTTLNTALIYILFPFTAVYLAQFCHESDIGVFNFFIFLENLPTFLVIILSFIFLDLFIYVQHLILHATPILWRFHRIHHVDLDYDVTTGARFHSIEILLSMLIKFGLIIFLGPSPEGVILFEVLLNSSAMFNHSNVQLPKTIDKWVRLVFVTPNMHRIHHSVVEKETNSNFGFCLSFWDFIFGTHTQEAQQPDPKFQIGIKEIRDPKDCTSLIGLLKLPFVNKTNGYTINQKED
jgi:sterol desaturase/sphingolipid hydroxylase (fatty acid hydroxylase superfamily)